MAQRLKRLPAVQETWVRFLGQEDPLEKEMATHSSILPGESHGWRSLVGYSPRGRQESDTTEQLHFHFHFGRLEIKPGFWERIQEGRSRVGDNEMGCLLSYPK